MSIYPLIPFPAHAGITGFESPAAQYAKAGLSLDELLILHPSTTWIGVAKGDSMIGEGIFDGDLLIVDRDIIAENNSVIVARLNGEFVCKILDKNRRMLLSSNEKYQAVPIHEYDEFSVEGVVIRSIRMLHKTVAVGHWQCTP
uniref:DNA polymerase V subunit, UmuD n=1 Tax=Shewanella putrefaciens (strain 200) TaxID=399804 RepID=E6XGX6_SHEP2